MECKVKIGINYEPRWFERRQTNGYYSGKNPPLDSDGMWLQSALIGAPKKRGKVATYAIAGVAFIFCIFFFAYA
jgi:hypothetical protein